MIDRNIAPTKAEILTALQMFEHGAMTATGFTVRYALLLDLILGEPPMKLWDKIERLKEIRATIENDFSIDVERRRTGLRDDYEREHGPLPTIEDLNLL